MARLFAAAVLLAFAAAPAFACDWQKSAATTTQKQTVASQPANDRSAAPARVTSGKSS